MDIMIENISKAYGDKQVLRSFSAQIKAGGITSVMAPSGVGKTTLLRILAGLEAADSGRIGGLKDKKISMVFQEDRLCSGLNAVSNIRLACDKGVTGQQIARELERIGLKGSELAPVCQLSGGMKRRVALVRALMAPWDILLMDEPFQGLDEKNKWLAMDYTKERVRGKTVIMVTHDKNEAEYMNSRMITLQEA